MEEVSHETTPLLKDGSSRPINDGDEVVERYPLTGCGATICCDPYRPVHRFVVLILMCFLGFGSYFCYDSPGALQPQIKDDMSVTTAEYMLLYSLYSWPNVVLCFFGGYLIDRVFGIRLGTIIFSTLVTIGQVVFASGALVNHYWLMEGGRFVFGLGGESLAVAQNTYAVSWFKDKELNMVFGLQLSFARVGSTVNFNVMKPLYDLLGKSHHGYQLLGIVLMLAVFTCLFSLGCALVLAYFDKRAEKLLNKKEAKTGEVIQLKDILTFPISFWLISIICVAYYVAVFPFIGLGNEFFMQKYEFDSTSANAVSSLVYIISAAASPFVGFAIDKVGRNLMWVLVAICITLACHATIAFTFINPYVPMTFMGISYSMLASSLWPMVSLIIPEYQLGTAYGMMQSVQNLGLAVIAIVAGTLVDNNGYLVLEVFFLAWLCVAIMAVILLWIVNDKLNLSAVERHRRKKEALDKESLNQERLMASGSMADTSPQDLLHDRSTDTSVRNRHSSKPPPYSEHTDPPLTNIPAIRKTVNLDEQDGRLVKVVV